MVISVSQWILCSTLDFDRFHFVARENLRRKHQAIRTLQSAVRRYIAQQRLRRFRLEEDLYREAARERDNEEQRLLPTMGARRAREEAERKYQERIRAIKRDLDQREDQERHVAKQKRRLMEQNSEIDEHDVFNQMFPSHPDDDSRSRTRSKIRSTAGGMHSTLDHMPSSSGSNERIDRSFPLPKVDEDLAEYTFAKFATTYFQGNATGTFTKKTLKQPLLALKSERDQLVSRRIFIDLKNVFFLGGIGHLDNYTSIYG